MNAPDAEVAWRLGSVEQAIREERDSRRDDIKKLDAEKADAKDVSRLADEFKSLRLTLQWFMGVVAAACVAFVVLLIQIASNH